MPINGAYTPYDMDRIQRAIAYIHKHYRTRISADQLAEEVNMDIKQLQTGIQLTTGMTIHSYHLKIRVENAATDLADFSMSIKQIASRHGFGSAKHFRAVFKKITGNPPKIYRLELLGKGNHLPLSGENKDKNNP